MTKPNPSSTTTSPGDELMATVGTEAQIITLTLDALLARRFPIDRVSVFHTDASGPVMTASLQKLEGIRPYYASLPRPVELVMVPYTGPNGSVIADIFSEAEESAVEATFYREIRRAKLEGRRVHLLPIGGFTDLALMALPMAQLLFDPDDYCWSMRSSTELLRSKRMRATEVGDEVRLKQKRIINWSADTRAVLALGAARDPENAVRLQEQLLSEEAQRRQRQFVQVELTPSERKAFLWAALTGDKFTVLARRLVVEPKTIQNQYYSACNKYKHFYRLPDGTRLSRPSLDKEFHNLAHAWDGPELDDCR